MTGCHWHSTKKTPSSDSTKRRHFIAMPQVTSVWSLEPCETINKIEIMAKSLQSLQLL